MTATSKPDQAPARSRGSSRARRRGARNRDGNSPQNPQTENDLFDVENGGEEGSSAPRESDGEGAPVVRAAIRVLRASAEECAVHEASLADIAKANKGLCLWLPPAAEAAQAG